MHIVIRDNYFRDIHNRQPLELKIHDSLIKAIESFRNRNLHETNGIFLINIETSQVMVLSLNTLINSLRNVELNL